MGRQGSPSHPLEPQDPAQSHGPGVAAIRCTKGSSSQISSQTTSAQEGLQDLGCRGGLHQISYRMFSRTEDGKGKDQRRLWVLDHLPERLSQLLKEPMLHVCIDVSLYIYFPLKRLSSCSTRKETRVRQPELSCLYKCFDFCLRRLVWSAVGVCVYSTASGSVCSGSLRAAPL